MFGLAWREHELEAAKKRMSQGGKSKGMETFPQLRRRLGELIRIGQEEGTLRSANDGLSRRSDTESSASFHFCADTTFQTGVT